MDAQQVLQLFDSYWLDEQIITKKPVPPPLSSSPAAELQKDPLKPEISSLQSCHVRSLSDQLGSVTSSYIDILSPKSVLHSHKLETIHSGKEVKQQCQNVEEISSVSPDKVCIRNKIRSSIRKKIRSSKSLSDLEFEELKGFMDLGFAFSEEDKNSELVCLIPGLQRLGKTDVENVVEDESIVSRPYLSEAWEIMEQNKTEKHNSLLNWKIPALSNETDMKDHLRHWAHAVASTTIK